MPLFDDPFSGHFESDDPRTPVFAAGGCKWPTVPAWRYILCPAGTWGIFAGLDGVNVQLRVSVGQPAHDDCSWAGFNIPWPMTTAVLRKQWIRSDNSQLWILQIAAGSGCGTVQWAWTKPESKCNVDHHIGASECEVSPPIGGFGSGTWLYQCEYDKISRDECRPPT